MANDPTIALLTAIVARLRADAGVSAIIGARAFDESPPQDTPYPFASVGSFTSTDFGEADVPGVDMTFVVHSWARSAARNAMVLSSAVYTALHERDFSVSGFQLVLCRFVSSSSVVDPDGKTHHVASTFRVIITTSS